MRPTILLLVLAPVLAAAQEGPTSNRYDELRTAAVARCSAIDPDESQTGMIFNPAGYRSVYLRSACLQDAAVQFRDESLCAQVRERRSLFFSSWGYSTRRCQELVATALDEDRRELQAMSAAFTAAPTTLRDFAVGRHGNGRDVEIRPSFDAATPHSYALSFEILDTTAPGGRALLHASSYHLDASTTLSIFVRRADIEARFPAFSPDRPYRVLGTLVFDVGHATTGGWRSDGVIEEVFPREGRTTRLEKTVIFGIALPPG